MRAGDVLYAAVYVTAAGAPVLGLISSDFTVPSYVNGTTIAPSFTATEKGAGWYSLAITTSGTSGFHVYTIRSAGRYTSPDVWSGALGAQDLDTIYAAVIRPSATLGSTAVVATALDLSCIANRYAPISVAVTDQNGVAVDLSGYNNWRFTVWDKLHATTVYTLSSGITGSAGGVVAWAIPETASFFTQMAAAIAANADSVILYYDMVADQAATAAQSRTVFRGTLTMIRNEAVS